MTAQPNFIFRPKTRPLLKWAGGKTQLLAEIQPKIPDQYGRYIEPFVGGSLFFSQNILTSPPS